MFEYLYKFRNCGSRVGYRDKIRPVPTVAELAAKSAAAFIRASQIISTADFLRCGWKTSWLFGGRFFSRTAENQPQKTGFLSFFPSSDRMHMHTSTRTTRYNCISYLPSSDSAGCTDNDDRTWWGHRKWQHIVVTWPLGWFGFAYSAHSTADPGRKPTSSESKSVCSVASDSKGRLHCDTSKAKCCPPKNLSWNYWRAVTYSLPQNVSDE